MCIVDVHPLYIWIFVSRTFNCALLMMVPLRVEPFLELGCDGGQSERHFFSLESSKAVEDERMREGERDGDGLSCLRRLIKPLLDGCS